MTKSTGILARLRMLGLGVGLLSVGSVLYLLFRPWSLLMFRWLDVVGFADAVAVVRTQTAGVGEYLPDAVVYSLPFALWVAAYLVIVSAIWRGAKTVWYSVWMWLVPLVAIASEFAQGLGLLPGTFDVSDLVALAAAIGMTVISIGCYSEERWAVSVPNAWRRHIASFALVTIFGVLAAGSVDNDSSSSNANKVQAIRAKPTSFVVSAVQLFKDYRDHEIRADEKYKGRFGIISGVVDNVGRDVLDTAIISFDTGSALFSVVCYFPKEEESKLAQVRKGSNIQVKGRVEGKFGSVMVKDCILMKY